MSETNVASVVPTVLRTLRKLTRSLKFRIYYYCEPCVANKKQKVNKNVMIILIIIFASFDMKDLSNFIF